MFPSLSSEELSALKYNHMDTFDVVVYHAFCLDGYFGALAANLRLGDAPVYYAANYMSECKPSKDLLEKCEKKRVVFIDFCWDLEVMEDLYRVTKGQLLILDHHITAYRALQKSSVIPGDSWLIKVGMSGASIAWAFFHRCERERGIDYYGSKGKIGSFVARNSFDNKSFSGFLLECDKCLCCEWGQHIPLLWRYVEDLDVGRSAFVNSYIFAEGGNTTGRSRLERKKFRENIKGIINGDINDSEFSWGHRPLPECEHSFRFLIDFPQRSQFIDPKRWFGYLRKSLVFDFEGASILMDCIQSASMEWQRQGWQKKDVKGEEERGFDRFCEEQLELQSVGSSCYYYEDKLGHSMQFGEDTRDGSDRWGEDLSDFENVVSGPKGTGPAWEGFEKVVRLRKYPFLKCRARNSVCKSVNRQNVDLSMTFFYVPQTQLYKVSLRSNLHGADSALIAEDFLNGKGGGHSRAASLCLKTEDFPKGYDGFMEKWLFLDGDRPLNVSFAYLRFLVEEVGSGHQCEMRRELDLQEKTFNEILGHLRFVNAWLWQRYKNNSYKANWQEGCEDKTWREWCEDKTWREWCEDKTWREWCEDKTWREWCEDKTWREWCEDKTWQEGCEDKTWREWCEDKTWREWCEDKTWREWCEDKTWREWCEDKTWREWCEDKTWREGCEDKNWYHEEVGKFSDEDDELKLCLKPHSVDLLKFWWAKYVEICQKLEIVENYNFGEIHEFCYLPEIFRYLCRICRFLNVEVLCEISQVAFAEFDAKEFEKVTFNWRFHLTNITALV